VGYALANLYVGEVRGGEDMDDEHDFFAGIQIETPCIPKG